ncbi:MAG: tetratricopeptide repeat protein [Saprospiraceae bacterium]|nr:tetratricopeptide repeat protein [Saprospiraceae bacterium]
MKTIFTTSDCLSLHELQSYRAGKLSKRERRRVEEHLIDCPLCNGALEGLAQSKDPTQDARQLQSLPFRKGKISLPYQIAAVLLIGLIIIAAIWLRPKPDAQSLFATYYERPQPTKVQLRGTTETAAQQALQSALKAYQMGDFSAAYTLLEGYVKDFPQENQVYLWMGVAQLELGKTEQAIQLFQQLKASNKEYDEKASWYLILASLKAEDYDYVRKLVQELEASDGQEFRAALVKLRPKLKRLPKH